MTYLAQVIRILIAAPKDAYQEVKCIRNIIREWNDTHSRSRRVVLDPMHYETHAYPVSGSSAQPIINNILLSQADLVVAIFRDTFGTPTEDYDSGTEEEIVTTIGSNKQTMIYFYTGKISRSHDKDQINSINRFKKWCKKNALYWEYKSITDLKNKFQAHLALKLQIDAGIIKDVRGIFCGQNVFEQMGYDFVSVFNKAKQEIIFAGPTLRSWLSFEDRKERIVNFINSNDKATISFILGDTNILRELGPGEEGVKTLIASAKDLYDIRKKLSPASAERLRIFFDTGAATLSGVFIDPDDDSGILFFTPRWGKDYQPRTRLTCMIERRANPELFEAVWTDSVRVVMRQSYVKGLDKFLEENS